MNYKQYNEELIEENYKLREENILLQQENKQLNSILTELEKWLREYFSINNGASECPLSSQSEIKEMKIENKFILEVLRRISELKEKYK